MAQKRACFDLKRPSCTYLYSDVFKTFFKQNSARFNKPDASKLPEEVPSKTTETSEHERLLFDSKDADKLESQNEEDFFTSLLKLIPKIKVDMTEVRFTFGNQKLRHSLVATAKSISNLIYTTRKPVNEIDLINNFVSGNVKQFKLTLVKGKINSNDRKSHLFNAFNTKKEQIVTGVSLVVNMIAQDTKIPESDLLTRDDQIALLKNEVKDLIECASLRFRYTYDEPNTNVVMSEFDSQPEYRTTLILEKHAVLHYSAEIDSYRDELYKFFYPPDFKAAQKTPEMRTWDFIKTDISFLEGADIHLNYNYGNNDLRIKVKAGSTVEIDVPMYQKSDGSFDTKVNLNFLNPSIYSDLVVSNILAAETGKICVSLANPMNWNEQQDWIIERGI